MENQLRKSPGMSFSQLQSAFQHLSDPECHEEVGRVPLYQWPRKVIRRREYPLPHIQVLNPREEGWDILYDISIKTRHQAFSLCRSTITRSYSEFSWLRKQLLPIYKGIADLPSKGLFFLRRNDEVLQKDLEKFINRLIAEPLFLSDTVLHLFLQTDLSLGEMEDFINGRLTEKFIKNLWATGGKRKRQSTLDHHVPTMTYDCEDAVVVNVISSFVDLSQSNVSSPSLSPSSSTSSSHDETSLSSSDEADQLEKYDIVCSVASTKKCSSEDSGVNV